jgi:hypothetical protein
MTQSSLVYSYDAGYYAFMRGAPHNSYPAAYTQAEIESWLDGYDRACEDRSRSDDLAIMADNRSNY